MWGYPCYELYGKVSTIEEVGLELITRYTVVGAHRKHISIARIIITFISKHTEVPTLGSNYLYPYANIGTS